MTKTVLLASAAVLGLGVSSSFAATYGAGANNTPTMQNGPNAPSTYQPAPAVLQPYAFFSPYASQNSRLGAAGPMAVVPATPRSALEAYSGDAPGGA